MWEQRFLYADQVLNRSPMLAIRDGRWKLLLNPDGSRSELYLIGEDPTEINNLITVAPNSLIDRLTRMLLDWKATLPDEPSRRNAGNNSYPWPRPKPASTP